MLLSGTASRISRTSHGLFCWLVAPTVREVFQIPCMSDTNLLSGKQAEKWNVVLLVMPQGLSSADPEPEDAHRPCCQSGFGCKSKTEHFSMWAILHAKRGRGVCVCACLCVQRRKFFFYLKYDSSHTQRNLSCPPVFSQCSITTELTRYMSQAYYWRFAILLSQFPDNICSSQEAPDHPLTYPTAKQQMSWCLWTLKPEKVVAE